jgi:DHA1 family tetracycline resistance protein-like MFS transporter
MWTASALCLANFGAAWLLLPESRTTGAGARAASSRFELLTRAFARPRLLLLLVLYFLISFAFSGFEATFALFSEHRFGFTAATIGYVFAFVGLVLALVQGVLVGRVVPIVGEARLIPIAVAVIALGLSLVPFSASIPMLLLAVGTLATGMGFNGPSLSAMISRMTHADDQGGILGLAQSLASLGRIAGPAWGGFLFDRFGPRTPYLSAAAIMAIAFIVALVSLSPTSVARK